MTKIKKMHELFKKTYLEHPLRHTRSVAYSVELAVLNKHQISGGRAHLDCYREEKITNIDNLLNGVVFRPLPESATGP